MSFPLSLPFFLSRDVKKFQWRIGRKSGNLTKSDLSDQRNLNLKTNKGTISVVYSGSEMKPRGPWREESRNLPLRCTGVDLGTLKYYVHTVSQEPLLEIMSIRRTDVKSLYS